MRLEFWRSKKVVDLEQTIHCCYWPPRSKWLAKSNSLAYLLLCRLRVFNQPTLNLIEI